MTWTRTKYFTEVRELMDARTSTRLTAQTLTAVLSATHRAEWRSLLEKNPDLRTAVRTGSTDSDGFLLRSALQTGAGDSETFPYKVYAVAVDGVPLTERKLRDYPFVLQQPSYEPYRTWWIENSGIQVSPPAVTALQVRLSHLPTSLANLATDNSPVEWPEDHEHVLVHRAAAIGLGKGAAEADAATYLNSVARQLRTEMYEALWRETGKPVEFLYADEASDWGVGGWGS